MDATRRLAWLETRFLGELIVRSDDSMLGAFDIRQSAAWMIRHGDPRTRYASCPAIIRVSARAELENSINPAIRIAVIRKARRVATPFAGEQIGERSTNVHGSLEYRVGHVRNDLWREIDASRAVVPATFGRCINVACRFTAGLLRSCKFAEVTPARASDSGLPTISRTSHLPYRTPRSLNKTPNFLSSAFLFAIRENASPTRCW